MLASLRERPLHILAGAGGGRVTGLLLDRSSWSVDGLVVQRGGEQELLALTSTANAGARLVSSAALLDCPVRCADGDFGRVRDLIYDDTDWTLAWLVVEPGADLPGRDVLVSPEWIEALDLEHRRLQLGFRRDWFAGPAT